MTDDLSPEEKRQHLASIPVDTARALRLHLAMDAGDTEAAIAVVDEIKAVDPGGLMALAASSSMACRLAYELAARTGRSVDTWLYTVAAGLMDQASDTAAHLDDDESGE